VGNFVAFLMHLGYYVRTNQLPQLGSWTYLVLAILVAIEGPIATLLGAAAASAGLMRPWLVFAAAAAGNLTADSLWYSLGYLGKLEWVLRFGRRLGVRQDFIDRLQSSMHEHALRIIFIAKLTVSFVIPSLIAAGLVRIPWKRWFPAIFAGEMIWTGSLVLIGYFTTEAMKRIEQGIGYMILAGTLVIVFSLLWLAHRYLTKEYQVEVKVPTPDDK